MATPVFEGGVHDGVVDTVQFQLEKQKLRADAGQLVLSVAEELGAGRIGGVGQ